MKRSVFCWLTICGCLATLVILVEPAHAQTPPTEARYWVNWILGPAPTTRIVPSDLVITTDQNGVPFSALVVGYYNRTDRANQSAFVYDVFGSIDPDDTYSDPDPGNPNDPIPNRFWDIEELVGPTPPGLPWTSASEPLSTFRTVFRGVNSAGLVAGYVNDPNGDRHAVYLRLDQMPLELVLIPDAISPSQQNYAVEATESGDILIIASNGSGYQGFVYRPDDESMTPILDPTTGTPILTRGGSWTNFSSVRDFIGLRNEDSVVFRHSMITGDTEFFPDLLNYVPDCNELGDFVSGVIIPRPKGRRYDVHAIRVGINGTDWVGPAGTQGIGVNDHGDVLVEEYPDRGNFSYFHEGLQQSMTLGDLVIEQSDPDGSIRFALGSDLANLSNRDQTGLGWIALGRGAEGLALLIPQLPQPVPGISVSPASGLVTMESGATDSFDVVLITEPTADVTIGISSSDTSEGTVNVASLSFTPTNWNVPRTVTIAGVDDAIDDGDMAYTIITAAAVSTDDGYNGLNADDVMVTNLDDEGPPVYSSTDTPLDIPDNNSTGINSTINVGDNNTITGLTVTLDISHQRSSDLNVHLMGPNGASVQLFNYTGDNNVPNFNGISSVGPWTLQTIDTRNKKTGTLNSWSMTVDTN